jgi:hypothetical protein
MTINHVFVYVKPAFMPTMQAFYKTVLQPIGYTQMITTAEGRLVGYGSDYPYLWLKQVPDGHEPYPVHVALDAPNNEAVDEFHQLGL